MTQERAAEVFARAAVDSAATQMARSPRDWSKDSRDAWLYGLIVGWGDALEEVASRHGWNQEHRDRLCILHASLPRSEES